MARKNKWGQPVIYREFRVTDSPADCKGRKVAKFVGDGCEHYTVVEADEPRDKPKRDRMCEFAAAHEAGLYRNATQEWLESLVPGQLISVATMREHGIRVPHA